MWNQWYNDVGMSDGLRDQHARTDMEKIYVEQQDGGYWITGTRISLDSIA
jgi:hypothetical protein